MYEEIDDDRRRFLNIAAVALGGASSRRDRCNGPAAEHEHTQRVEARFADAVVDVDRL
jgi:hypothetical protein